jgi:flavin-dependent dehydrogenase
MATWDLAVVGAGPAGAAAALGALHAEPGLRVALLDRADFPRDKACRRTGWPRPVRSS